MGLPSTFLFAVAVTAMSPAPAPAPPASIIMDPSMDAPPVDRTLPARLVACTLHHALNVDPTKDQAEGDIRYEGDYRIDVALPATSAARPEDYKLVADSQALLGPVRRPFTRVADQWPKTVQLARTETKGLTFMILSEIDPKARTAVGYLSRGADGADIDISWIFQGRCSVTTGAAAARASGTPRS